MGKPFFTLFIFCLLSVFVVSKYLIRLSAWLLKQKPVLPKLSFPKAHFPAAKKIVIVFLTISILALTSAFAFWNIVLKDLPSAEILKERSLPLTSRIYDRNGVLLYSLYKDENRTLVPLEKVPMHVRLATLAIEDADFYSHNGFSIKGMSRALLDYLKEGKVTGGSTITQQLVKNALLTHEKTLVRKLKEIVIALDVEQSYSKDAIFEMYLNEVSYGGTAFGIEEASKLYFDKSVDQLTLGEAALLAGLPRSPTSLSPFGTNTDLAMQRQKVVLDLMVKNNFISIRQAELAKNEPLTFADNTIEMKAPHFVMYVKQLLAEKYGENYVLQGGFEVTTTLDYSIQQQAELAINEELAKLQKLHVTNGAALVVNPKTGEILAMVGSKDYFDIESQGNVNVLLQSRQPGSSIKVVNYAYALSHGLTPATIIDDSPITFKVESQEPYKPKNYDGKFRGRITLRSALAESRNIPAVKVLNRFGVQNMLTLGEEMGITTWDDRSRYGLSLTLGGGEVKLIDLASVYSTLANYGSRPDLFSITKITDKNNKKIFESKCTNGCNLKKVIDPRVAFMLTDILKDNSARSPAFGTRSALVIPQHSEVAVKTGTSNDLRDNITVGYSQDYLVAVWVGNNDNSPMSRIASGITGAAPIWNKIMQHLLLDKDSIAWSPPEGLIQVEACSEKEWYLKESVPKRRCIPERIASEDSKHI